jgi:hypothetical protein
MPKLPTPDAIRKLPLQYGSWRTLKALYKQLEVDPGADTPRLGALIARLDAAQADPGATPQSLSFKGARYINDIESGDGATFWMIGGDDWRERKLLAYRLDVETLQTEALGSAEIDENARLAACGRFALTGFSDRTGTWLTVWEALGKTVRRIAAEKLDAEILGLTSVDGLVCVLVGGKRAELRVYALEAGGAPTLQSTLSLSGFDGIWPGVGGVVVRQSGRGLSLQGLPRPAGVAFIDLSVLKNPALSEVVPVEFDSAVGGRDFIAVLEKSRTYEKTCRVFIRKGGRLQSAGKVLLGHISSEIKTLTLGRRVFSCTSYNSQVVWIGPDGKPKIERWRHRPEGSACTADGRLISTGQWRGGYVWQLPDGFPDAKPVLLGGAPSAATIGYMKRRTRRLLKNLAKSDPKKYLALAHATLKASDGFILEKNWALAEVLYGGGGRLRQAGHGRGNLSLAPGPKLNLRRREELCPEAWDARPELSAEIYADPKAGWGAREMAARQLRVAKRAFPSVPDDALIADLGSPSPLLQALAGRVAIEKVRRGESLPAALLGHVWFRAGRAGRQKLEPALNAVKNSVELCKALAAHIAVAPSTVREKAALTLLAERFPGPATPLVHPGWLPLLLDSGGALKDLALARLKTSKFSEVEGWLTALESVADGTARDEALDALAQVLKGERDQGLWGWRWRLIESRSAFQRAAWWCFLAARKANEAAATHVWRELLAQGSLTDALRTAMTSPHALALLTKYIPAEEFQQALQDRPFLVDALDAATFKSLTQTLPLDAVLRLSAAASDETWARLRGGLLENLTEGVRLVPFWQALEQAISEPGGDVLETRFLQSDDFAATLLPLGDHEAILAIRAVAFEPLLVRWAERHREKIGESERLRRLAATHPLGGVRAIGIAEGKKRLLNLPFALALLESEVPDAVALGAGFFEGLPHGGPDEYGAALALCDSPARSVRARGREFVAARKATLPADRILESLLEHDDPEMQDFVAEAGADTDAPTFDAAVLKTRRRARRAKEKIKTRQEARPTMDTDALLALARQKTSPRDAEWALSQLVKRALAGETIAGLEITQ